MSQQINLYNPLFLKKEKHFSARTMAQALALVVAAIAVVGVLGRLQTRSAERLADQYRGQVASVRAQLVKLGGISSPARSKALEAEIARLEAEVKTRQATLQALSGGEFGNTAGFSEFLAALGRQAMSGVWLTRIRVDDAGNALFVEGRALRADLVPAYLRGLSREPMMQGRRVTEMKLAASAAKGASAASPASFVEFSLAAPLALREPAAGERKP
jgi:hypothetical protein